MAGPSPRKKPARASRSASPSPPPRKATEAEIEQALATRRDELITADAESMLDEMANDLGRQQKQIVADRIVISRLVNHVLALDPDGEATKRLVAAAQEQLAKEGES